ncbi:MAG: hypothetical protein MZW92_16545, partial [Comamonadaceae bacterium]|nr:hypothetical protein [Comamonadaceae bacterium]
KLRIAKVNLVTGTQDSAAPRSVSTRRCRRRGRAQPGQADELQGRVRGGAPVHRRRASRRALRRAVRGRAATLEFHMAPPLLARAESAASRRASCASAPWLLHGDALAGARAARCAARCSTRSAAPRSGAPERALIARLRGARGGAAAAARTRARLRARRVQVAQVPAGMRGFGHVKLGQRWRWRARARPSCCTGWTPARWPAPRRPPGGRRRQTARHRRSWRG